MRRPERIPIFLEKVDWDKLEERWQIDISQSLRGEILAKRYFWEQEPDLRFGQWLINLGLLPDHLNIWNDEEDWILSSQGIPAREYKFWGRNFDKDMNRLPKTEWILIKDMTTDHIQAILDGNWAVNKEIFENELLLRK